ncbi:MAG: type II toxin-antitoxin system VapC family toxin [Pseudomonadota bacterium]|jgi:PIN domain nuclease of toxin-antitoxin system
MRLLLDTHVFLWVVEDSARLSDAARKLIAQASEVYVSTASLWEISIKASAGKIVADIDSLAAAIEGSGMIPLPVSLAHAVQVAHLPLRDGHKDPFDRLLVAQSMSEPLVLLTADRKLEAYGGPLRVA